VIRNYCKKKFKKRNAAMQTIQQLEKEVQRLKIAVEELSHIGQNL